MRDISFYLGHDSNVTIYDIETKEIQFYSLEKYFDKKHVNLGMVSMFGDAKKLYKCYYNFFKDIGVLDETFSNIYIKRFKNPLFDASSNDRVAYLLGYPSVNFIFCLLKAKNKIVYTRKSPADHHKLHARYAYGESGFKKSLAFTYDAGGDWETSSVVGFDNNTTSYFKYLPNQMVSLYANCGKKIKEIEAKTLLIDVGGKVMGFSAYGKSTKFSDKVLRKFRNFEFTGIHDAKNPKDLDRLNIDLKNKIYTIFNLKNDEHRLETPEESADYAWCLQQLFEEGIYYHFKKEVLPKCSEYDNNVVLSGGGALNVLFNSKIKSLHPEINFYVPPDPTDGSLSLGLMMHHHREIKQFGKYGTEKLYDAEKLDDYIRLHSATPCTVNEFVDLLNKGKIIGYLYGNIEIGPRALCHRSILCSAKYPNMKDLLNAKVKHREWFRPFAPVCREEDAKKYFDIKNWDASDFSTMAYSVMVKEKYKEKLQSITHIDNSARLQTLRQEDAPFIYDALNKVDGNVLLNTSFNDGGKPILNTISTALDILKKTDMNYVLIYDEKRNVHWMFS